MNHTAEIILHLDRLDQLIEPFSPSPFLKRQLFVEQAKRLPRGRAAEVILYLPGSDAARARDLSTTFRQRFAFRGKESNAELRRIRRFGCRSLAVAFMFLAALILLVSDHQVHNSILQEGFTILGLQTCCSMNGIRQARCNLIRQARTRHNGSHQTIGNTFHREAQ